MNDTCLCACRVLPPAEQFRGFPQTKCRGGTEYGRDALKDTFGECVVAKANEADCGAQTPKSKHREEGGNLKLNSLKDDVITVPFRCITLKRPEETKNPKVRAAKRMKNKKEPSERQP